MQIDIDFTNDELAAIAAVVARQKEADPELTSEQLIAHLAKKQALNWVAEQTSEVASRYLADITTRITALPAGDRLEAVERIKAAVDAVTEASAARALAVEARNAD